MVEQILKPSQISFLETVAENSSAETLRRRARILLLYNSGQTTTEVSQIVGISSERVRYWRREFLKRGMDIFPDENEIQAPVRSRKKRTASVKGSSKPASGLAVSATPAELKATSLRFPRPRRKPGIKPDDSMVEAGRKTLLFHFAQMLRHEKGTRLGEDIEELHDMRVATRRMRAAFDIFGPFFKPKVVKFHLKGLRATGRALGRVRDLDVFMEKAQRYIMTVTEQERPGLEPLMNAWQKELSIERNRMLAFLESDRYLRFKQDFNAFLSSPMAEVQPHPETSPKPKLVRHVAPVLIYTHLAMVRSYEAVIANAAIAQLHALRIEFKRLRYLMEFFREVLGEQAKEVIEELKMLQDHLGDLNDAYVACRILREFVESWQERQIELPLQERQNQEPVVAYLAAKHAELHTLMVTFPESWAHFNRPELLRDLAQAISVL
jgi:CHAD domain-containing protein/transposase-like protein